MFRPNKQFRIIEKVETITILTLARCLGGESEWNLCIWRDVARMINESSISMTQIDGRKLKASEKLFIFQITIKSCFTSRDSRERNTHSESSKCSRRKCQNEGSSWFTREGTLCISCIHFPLKLINKVFLNVCGIRNNSWVYLIGKRKKSPGEFSRFTNQNNFLVVYLWIFYEKISEARDNWYYLGCLGAVRK